VRTRDTWSLQPGAKVAYAGGTSRGGVSLRDHNLLGTGTSFGIAWHRSSAVSTAGGTRRSVDLDIRYPFAFDGRTSIAYGRSSFDEGSTRFLRLDRPFYELDSRWAAGAAASRDDRVVSSYAGGVIAAHYRQRHDSAYALLGGSQGLVRGWAHRWSGGLRYQDEAYQVEPGLAGPAQLPTDRTLVVPFLRYEAVQDEFREVKNLDQIGRPEYLALGWLASLQFGRAAKAFGSTQAVSQYAVSLSKGVRVVADGVLLASASFSGEYTDGRTDRESLGASARFYQRRGSSTVFYLSLAADATNYADATQFLSLGGETGLRGYPTNYQLGARRVLLTAERRFYADWYPFRLVRVGGAVFVDVGRAWGGPYQNDPSAHWLADIGFGLRLLSARSSSGTTVHMDLAFPLERAPGVKSVQISLQSKTGF
jgi:outer membrane protein assembly factor BamA